MHAAELLASVQFSIYVTIMCRMSAEACEHLNFVASRFVPLFLSITEVFFVV